MKKILISIDEEQEKILESLKENGLNKTKMIRNLISLLKNATSETMFIALNDSDVCVVKDCGNTVANTFSGEIDSLDFTFKYFNGIVEEDKFECKIKVTK